MFCGVSAIQSETSWTLHTNLSFRYISNFDLDMQEAALFLLLFDCMFTSDIELPVITDRPRLSTFQSDTQWHVMAPHSSHQFFGEAPVLCGNQQKVIAVLSAVLSIPNFIFMSHAQIVTHKDYSNAKLTAVVPRKSYCFQFTVGFLQTGFRQWYYEFIEIFVSYSSTVLIIVLAQSFYVFQRFIVSTVFNAL